MHKEVELCGRGESIKQESLKRTAGHGLAVVVGSIRADTS